jgi:DNA repair photolyase
MKNETKEERFRRVAEKRVQNIIKGIRSLSQLSNNKIYNWNAEQLKKIWGAVEKEINHCKKHFEDPDADVFTL